MPVKVTIDGQELEVAAGKTIIQAAHEAGIDVPYYCYHPGLVVDGNCRICLVEVEKAPKLMVACKTAVTDGMVVHTTNERVEEARRAVMEFLLINHPIDCPVCDQAGECKLQDYYYDYDLADSRLRDRKVHKPKVQTFGEHVVFDGERCILCSRCVRFTRDVSESYELSIFNRGNSSVIGLAPGKTLDNPYSMNTVDICPVGALTSRDFRFRKRVWFLDEHRSVCTGCSRGCSTWLDASAKDNKIYRTRPRKNMLSNTYWMCDRGRFMFEWAEQDRLDNHQVDGAEASLATAASRAANLLRDGSVGVLLSRHSSNEELFALKQLLAGLGDVTIGVGTDRVADDGEIESDDFLIEADKNPNSAGVKAVFGVEDAAALTAALNDGRITTLLVCARRAGDVLGDAIARADHVIRLSAHIEELATAPEVQLAGRTWAEKSGTFTSGQGVTAAFEPALRAPAGSSDNLGIIAALGTALDIDVPGGLDDVWAVWATNHPELGGMTFREFCDRTAMPAGESVAG